MTLPRKPGHMPSWLGRQVMVTRMAFHVVLPMAQAALIIMGCIFATRLPSHHLLRSQCPLITVRAVRLSFLHQPAHVAACPTVQRALEEAHTAGLYTAAVILVHTPTTAHRAAHSTTLAMAHVMDPATVPPQVPEHLTHRIPSTTGRHRSIPVLPSAPIIAPQRPIHALSDSPNTFLLALPRLLLEAN